MPPGMTLLGEFTMQSLNYLHALPISLMPTFCTTFGVHFPQTLTWRIYIPSSNSVSFVVSALPWRTFPIASLLQYPPPLIPNGQYSPTSAPKWPRDHYSFHTRTPSRYAPPLPLSTGVATSAPEVRTFDTERRRTMSASLTSRLMQCGARTHC